MISFFKLNLIKEMEKITEILNKDTIWNRIKGYIYLIIALIVLLLILIITLLIITSFIFFKVNVKSD